MPAAQLDLNILTKYRPLTPKALYEYVYAFFGVKIARNAVCQGHCSPWQSFKDVQLLRPPVALILGPRGGGKSFLSGLDSHLTSRFNPNHSTRILGGSKAQSDQIYRAIHELVLRRQGPLGNDKASIKSLLKTEAVYANGSDVSILAASPMSVHGPHVPTLKLDEVDEIDPDLREAAMGMCMTKGDQTASTVMTSTWHKLGGPMSQLLDRGRAGEFPVYSFCVFEVLERCPESRSGPNLELCPACPLMQWCHADRANNPKLPPKAKLANGHYTIDSLIQKVVTVSKRTFEADYLCKGPKADGAWFPTFHRDSHGTIDAEYDPNLKVHLSIDSGVFTGAVWFQTRERNGLQYVTVFADYLSEGNSAGTSAVEIKAKSLTVCQGRRDIVSTDPAGNSRTSIGPTVVGEYVGAGLCTDRELRRWPHSTVADSLAFLESFVAPASGETTRLTIHPRCEQLIRAFEGYNRAKRGGQWQDYPDDPQHPSEDLIDALRGGLRVAFPVGHDRQSKFNRVHAGRMI